MNSIISDPAQIRRESVKFGFERLGWSFTPLAGKRPTLDAWQSRPRESLGDALTWAVAGNVGIRTGAASGGLVVIDIDEGGDVAALDLPETVSARSGSGGLHFYFRTSRTQKNTIQKLAPKIDTRGDGGQIVFPGSIHPETGAIYEWMPGREPWSIELAELPARICDELDAPKPAKPAPPTSTPAPSRPERRSDSTEARYVARAVKFEVLAVRDAVEGTRNASLNNAALALGKLVGGGYVARADIESELMDAALAAGLPDFEAAATIRSGLDAGEKQPRDVRAEIAKRRPIGRPRKESETPRRDSEPDTDKPASDSPLSGEPTPGTIDPETKRLILSVKRTWPTAESFVRDHYTHPDGRTLHRYAQSFIHWQGNRYAEIEDAVMQGQVMPWLHNAVAMRFDAGNDEWKATDFPANPGTARAAVDSIGSLTVLPASTRFPAWSDATRSEDPREILPCKTAMLHLPTMRQIGCTPKYLTFNGLDYDYDAAAPIPETWLKFLAQVFGEDLQSWDLLQEWFGYCLTGDTSQQKILLMVGPKRGGKGTIARVLTQLVGEGNVCRPTTSTLAGTFGLAGLVGKSLAIVSDARFSGDGVSTVVERLLTISGEDPVDVDRKYRDSVKVTLPTRFMVLSNELPKLTDASGALAGRFIILRLTNSFFNREDPKLIDKLLPELPGILNWAIEGWKRLNARGRFVQPASASDAMRDLEDLSSPVGAFVRERCEVGEGYRGYVSELYAAWREWCAMNGRDHPGTVQTFGRDLMAAESSLVTRRNHSYGRFLEGIQLVPSTPSDV